MKEFVCPDGTMSVDGVCRMFMTPNQREDLKVKEEIDSARAQVRDEAKVGKGLK